MTLTDELKVLEDKIKSNQGQYDLEREAAKISALSSKELDKYIHFKFEYSSLGEALSKGLKKIIKAVKFLNTTMIWCINLCITLINIVCLTLMKYHQLTLNLRH